MMIEEKSISYQSFLVADETGIIRVTHALRSEDVPMLLYVKNMNMNKENLCLKGKLLRLCPMRYVCRK